MKLWFEEVTELPDERNTFLVRLIKFSTHVAILFMLMYVIIAPQDAYYKEECEKRLNCYNHCNDDYFPALRCQEVKRMNFKYNNNVYKDFYLYTRPAEGSWNYDQCNSYLTQNENYPFISF